MQLVILCALRARVGKVVLCGMGYGLPYVQIGIQFPEGPSSTVSTLALGACPECTGGSFPQGKEAGE
jgi:hypothetical protein